MKSFSSQLSCSESLRWLTVAHNSIGNEGLEVLAESLSTNRHLTVLSLYGNPSITSAKSLANLIETNTSLTYLSVWGLNIGRNGVLLLLKALKKNVHLITLVLDNKDKETCQSSPLYEDVKHRIIFNIDIKLNFPAMFDEHKEQVPMTPSEQKEQCDEKAAKSVTETEGISSTYTYIVSLYLI